HGIVGLELANLFIGIGYGNAVELELSDFLHAVQGRGPQTVGSMQQAFDALTLVHRLYADDPSWAAVETRAAAE
ncbi:MAG: hypothetical protein AAFR41_09250, partial [Pseudomonadota bacterium]